MNIYMTSESELKLSSIITNIKNFFVFDVQEFIKTFKLDLTKPANIYFMNNEITTQISGASKLKKYKGIIYINRNLSEQLYYSMKHKFGNDKYIDKIILIDNGMVSKHKDLHEIFGEVYFYDRFKKTKIVDCNSMIPECSKFLEDVTFDMSMKPIPGLKD